MRSRLRTRSARRSPTFPGGNLLRASQTSRRNRKSIRKSISVDALQTPLCEISLLFLASVSRLQLMSARGGVLSVNQLFSCNTRGVPKDLNGFLLTSLKKKKKNITVVFPLLCKSMVYLHIHPDRTIVQENQGR